MAKPAAAGIDLEPLSRRLQALPPGALDGELIRAQTAAKREPGNPTHDFAAGIILTRLGDHVSAIETLKRALKRAADSKVILGALSFLLAAKAKDHRAALKYLRRKHQLNRLDGQTLLLMANSHLELGEAREAMKILDRAEPLIADKVRIHALRSRCMFRIGDSAGARHYYRMILKSDPKAVASVVDRVALLPDNTEQDLIELYEILGKLADHSPQSFRNGQHHTLSLFALGTVCERLGKYDEAFHRFAEMNRIQPKEREPDSFAGEFEILHQVFNKARFDASSGGGKRDPAPVFVVGMPRSGTTLIESILAGHRKIHDCGELEFFTRQLHFIGITAPRDTPIADAITQVKTSLDSAPINGFRDLGHEYTRQNGLQKFRGLLTVDKMPQNFMALGLIALTFPDAKIIHSMRDPMDCCASAYKNPLMGYHTAYANDLDSLGRYYLAYARLMRHWKTVLPLAIHDVRYEDVVSDTETTARAMIAFLGLDWDPACLSKRQQKRDVNTASAWQVRQQIYKSSLGTWRQYESHLQPLASLLAHETAAYTNSG